MLYPPQSVNSAKNSRSAGLDIVRTIACLTVIASHYFLYSHFKDSSFDTPSMFFQGVLATLAVGSDLYMILTGFLCCNKTVGKKFYMSGIKVIASYVFFSLLTICVNVYLYDDYSVKNGILGIFNFSTIQYAWYIEMWIGLFILAPFLNIWYKALPSKALKKTLIAIIFIMSALPDFFNRYGLQIMPQYWENIYPLGFYFFGSFLREYRPSFKISKLLAFAILIASLNSLFSFAVSTFTSHNTYIHIIGDRNGIFMGAMACMIFLAFYQFNLKNDAGKETFKKISIRSLDIFLCSAVFDAWLYPLFLERFYINQSQFGLYYFVIVPLIFCICFTINDSVKFEVVQPWLSR